MFSPRSPAAAAVNVVGSLTFSDLFGRNTNTCCPTRGRPESKFTRPTPRAAGNSFLSNSSPPTCSGYRYGSSGSVAWASAITGSRDDFTTSRAAICFSALPQRAFVGNPWKTARKRSDYISESKRRPSSSEKFAGS